jgi:hypothetical protein
MSGGSIFNGYNTVRGVKMCNIWSVLEYPSKAKQDDFKYEWQDTGYTGVPELAPQRKQTNADDNLDSKNANEEQLMACIREL